MRRSQGIVLILVGVAAILVGYFGYNQVFIVSAATAPVPLTTATVRRGAFEETVNATGGVTLTRKVDVTANVGSGRAIVTEVKVKQGDRVKQGDVLAQLDTTDLERAVEQAKANLSTAQINLEKTKSPYTASDIAQAQAAVREAEAAQEQAKINEVLTQKSDTVGQAVRNAQYLHNYYEIQAGEAKRKLDNNETTELDYQNAWNTLLNAKDKLATAQQQADLALATARSKVESATDGLRKAQDNLNKMLAGADSQDVQLRINDVVKAQIALDQAKENLAAATLAAPLDGIVSAVNVNPGDAVAANAVIATIVDPDSAVVEANVGEVDIASVLPDQDVRLTFDALPNVELRGKVTFVSPVATVQQGVVSYKVKVALEDADQAKLRESMSALADVVVQHKDNVLLVPNRAVRTSGRSRFVEVLENGVPTQRNVRVGSSNEQFTEIVDGLREGDVVVVRQTTTTQFQGPGGAAFFGGGPVRIPGR